MCVFLHFILDIGTNIPARLSLEKYFLHYYEKAANLRLAHIPVWLSSLGIASQLSVVGQLLRGSLPVPETTPDA